MSLAPRITPADLACLPAVQAAYAAARELQRAAGSTLWPDFGLEAVRVEIDAGRLYRVDGVASLWGVFSVAYADPAIWGERECGQHVYLHRIARDPGGPARGLMAVVLAWGRAHCRELGRRALRMDTWASNEALIAVYERLGFRRVGRRRLGADPRLPPHYHGEEFALLEDAAG